MSFRGTRRWSHVLLRRTSVQSDCLGRVLVRAGRLILGGALSIVAAVLAVIALLKGLARNGKGIAPVVFAAIFIALTWGGISIGGGTIW